MWSLRFFDFLFPVRSDERIVRSLTEDTFLALVRPTLVPETRPGTAALLPFHDTSVRAALHEAKYHGSDRAFTLLALVLADYLADLDLMESKKVYVVPVPLGPERRKTRGFNQVEEVARRALKGLPFTLASDLLIRTRETESQVSLPREKREQNMRGAFIVSPKLEERRRIDPSATYLLIDDVLTTGATLQAAMDALTKAGATNIIPIALAH